MKYLFLYLLLVNAIAFTIMLWDKKKAMERQRRIPERVLFGTAIIGGSVGTYLVMEIFRHKTNHKKISIGVPIMVVIHLLIAFALAFLDAKEAKDALNDLAAILE